MQRKRVLLVTSKYPYSKNESDGGLTTVASVIESIKHRYKLDILFVRKFSINENYIDGVENIIFEEIKNKSTSKYERRIFNYQQVSYKILELEKDYDFIIIIHASKAFGLENAPAHVLKKIILYPMFLSYAYRESGEIVPSIYDEIEKKTMQSIKWFVCPSNFDKRTIIKYYDLCENSFFVIPRSVTKFVDHRPRDRRNAYNILSIGNIKERKQPLMLLSIFKNVRLCFPAAKIVFAGEIQNQNLYEECLKFVKDNNLSDCVSFIGTVSQRQIGELIKTSDLNVCASNFETFGRCIFEGMYGGLPTVALDKLTCVKEFVDNGNGIVFAANEDDFFTSIVSLLADENKYLEFSQKAIQATNFISFEKEKDDLLLALDEIGGQI